LTLDPDAARLGAPSNLASNGRFRGSGSFRFDTF